jgi:hypothetical protein
VFFTHNNVAYAGGPDHPDRCTRGSDLFHKASDLQLDPTEPATWSPYAYELNMSEDLSRKWLLPHLEAAWQELKAKGLLPAGATHFRLVRPFKVSAVDGVIELLQEIPSSGSGGGGGGGDGSGSGSGSGERDTKRRRFEGSQFKVVGRIFWQEKGLPNQRPDTHEFYTMGNNLAVGNRGVRNYVEYYMDEVSAGCCLLVCRC